MTITISVSNLDIVLGLRSVTANDLVPGSEPRHPRNNATQGEARKMSLKGHKRDSRNLSDLRWEKMTTAKMTGIMQKVAAAKITIHKIVFMPFRFMRLIKNGIKDSIAH
jgi:hypothetical protein